MIEFLLAFVAIVLICGILSILVMKFLIFAFKILLVPLIIIGGVLGIIYMFKYFFGGK